MGLTVWFLAFLFGALSGASAPQEQDVPQDERRVLRLEIDACVDMALRNNSNLAASGSARAIAHEGVDEARGIFDPTFTTGATWTDRARPVGSRLGGADTIEETVINWDAGVNGLLPTGLTYNLNWRVDNTDTNNSFNLFNPITNNSLDVQVTQPLLRGAWTTTAEAPVARADLQEKIAAENYDQAMANLVRDTESAYWDLYFAYQDLIVKRFSLRLGEELLRITQRRYAEGLVPATDILTVRVDVSQRHTALINSESALYAAEDGLKRLIFNHATHPEWEFRIEALTKPRRAGEFPVPSLDQAIAQALTQRPEVRAARLQVQTRQLDLETRESELLPDLSLVGTWTSAAIGQKLSDTYLDTLSGKTQTYSVGLRLNLPLGNRVARARHRAAILQLRQALEQLRTSQNTVVFETREAIRNLEFLAVRARAAAQTRRNAEEQHRAQKLKWDLGLITQYDFQDVEEDLIQARTDELKTQTDYEKALSVLERNMGRAHLRGVMPEERDE